MSTNYDQWHKKSKLSVRLENNRGNLANVDKELKEDLSEEWQLNGDVKDQKEVGTVKSRRK